MISVPNDPGRCSRPDEPAAARPLEFKGMPVPYVAAWSHEASTDVAAPYLISRTNVFTGRVQVRYLDERPEDRDERGMLWHRVSENPGSGEPLFAQLHTTRQRRVMQAGRCQVCAGPANVWMTSESLWHEHLATFGAGAPFQSFDPPVCLACAQRAQKFCPAMGRGHVFLAPRAWVITLVRGLMLDPELECFHERTLRVFPAARFASPGEAGLMVAKALGVSLIEPTAHRDPAAAGGLGRHLDRTGISHRQQPGTDPRTD
jgi:hypothetical protein